MLDLPDGTVLLCGAGSQLYVYTPDGSPLAAGQPTVLGVTLNNDGTLNLNGTLFNGITQGGSFGDDGQMDSNYPLVRFTDTNGIVRYGRSTWNLSTDVATGGDFLQANCTIPANASLQDTIQVVANGNASPGVHYPMWDARPQDTKYVNFNFPLNGNGTIGFPFNSLPFALANAFQGTTIAIEASTNTSTIRIAQPIRISSIGGTSRIGP
jgi:hypothetical protein